MAGLCVVCPTFPGVVCVCVCVCVLCAVKSVVWMRCLSVLHMFGCCVVWGGVGLIAWVWVVHIRCVLGVCCMMVCLVVVWLWPVWCVGSHGGFVIC